MMDKAVSGNFSDPAFTFSRGSRRMVHSPSTARARGGCAGGAHVRHTFLSAWAATRGLVVTPG
jgi:hypothetical protein